MKVECWSGPEALAGFANGCCGGMRKRRAERCQEVWGQWRGVRGWGMESWIRKGWVLGNVEVRWEEMSGRVKWMGVCRCGVEGVRKLSGGVLGRREERGVKEKEKGSIREWN